MPQLPIMIDAGLPAGRYSQPFRSGWLDAAGIELRDAPDLEQLRGFMGVALVDAVLAAALFEQSAVVPTHTVASRTESMLNIVANQRLDGIDQAVLVMAGASESARTLAAVTLPRFYGITLSGWTDQPRAPDDGTVLLEEGAAALTNTEDDGLFHEDLGRAWFLLTQTPYVSHICIVPRRLAASDRTGVEQAIERLEHARRLATERARELRRDLARSFGVDRELLTEVLAEQTNELGHEELGGLKSLYSFSGRAAAADRLASNLISR